jgi:hypothetical protein
MTRAVVFGQVGLGFICAQVGRVELFLASWLWSYLCAGRTHGVVCGQVGLGVICAEVGRVELFLGK